MNDAGLNVVDHPENTNRLYFRTWVDADLPLAMKLWGDAEVTNLIGGPFSKAQVLARLAQEIDNQRIYGMQYWPIYSLADQQYVGCCGLRPYDLGSGILELGFHLRRKVWGQGYATEASNKVISFAFSALGAHALFAGHHPQNQASRHVLTKLNFTLVREEFYPPTGLMHPSYILKR